jgi:hypothetical protein
MEQQEKILQDRSVILMGMMFVDVSLFFTYISYFDILHKNLNDSTIILKFGFWSIAILAMMPGLFSIYYSVRRIYLQRKCKIYSKIQTH